MELFKAPEEVPDDIYKKPSVFLAGSIEQGAAEDWQERVEAELEDYEGYLLNPRRDHWDPTWEQKIENEQFYEQVTWELKGMDACELILMYFSPGTKSPVTLLELGLLAIHEGLIVVCPEGFWRKGNVDVICETFNIALTESLSEGIDWVQSYLEENWG